MRARSAWTSSSVVPSLMSIPRLRSSSAAYSASSASISGSTRSSRLGEHPAHPVKTGARIELHRLGREVLKLGERFEAGVAAADEKESEQLVAHPRIVCRVGELEALNDVVAQPDRVGQAFEADGVLVEAGDRQHPRDRSERDDERSYGSSCSAPSWSRIVIVRAAGSRPIATPSRSWVCSRTSRSGVTT